MLRKQKRVAILLVVALALAGAGYANRWRVLEPTVVAVSENPTRDFSDPRRLVGGATHVFLGEVTQILGTVDHYSSTMVQTEMRVKVLEVLKGEPGREMIVSQWGGLSKLQNVVRIYEGDPLLRVGEVALFSIAVAGNDGVTWQQTVFPGYGNVRIKGEESRLATLEVFKRAVREQITPEQEAAEVESQP